MDSIQHKKSAFKLAQLTQPIAYTIDAIQKILELEGDIDFVFPVNNARSISIPHLMGYTALHYAGWVTNVDLFTTLLKCGADFTKKNKNENTALHMLIVEKIYCHRDAALDTFITEKKLYTKSLDNPLTNAVLLAHVDKKNIKNPCNNDGLSHFHIACMTKNTVAVEFFLESGVSIEESVSENSKLCPGYSPLHFAAMCKNTKVAELLISSGANLYSVNAKQMTPLHLLIEQLLELHNLLCKAMINKYVVEVESLQKQIAKNEKIINMLLENTSIDNDSLDSIGLSNFHVTCMLQDALVAQQLVDQIIDLEHCVNMNSPLCPGFTALHFAAHVSLKTVEMLIQRGANFAALDANGLTPLDICLERYQIEDVCSILSLDVRYSNLLFSDGITTLTSFIGALGNTDIFERFIDSLNKNINMHIPIESSFWPNYTPLHLAVLCVVNTDQRFPEDEAAQNKMDRQIIKLCSKNDVDLSIQDSKGRTALHLAFRHNKKTTVDAILQHSRQIPNISDDEGLSHLHIACAMTETNNLKKFLLASADVNQVYRGTSAIHKVRPGSTPLHVALVNLDYYRFEEKIKILLDAGADPHIKDAYGLTPIHRLLETCNSDHYEFLVYELLNKVSSDCVVEEYGISYLHVACMLNNLAAVKRLIKNRANVNSTINYSATKNDNDSLSFLSQYNKCKPLHLHNLYFFKLNRNRSFSKIHQFFIEHGAYFSAKSADGGTFLESRPILNNFVDKVWKNAQLQTFMKEKFGWTRLHLACNILQREEFENVVKVELADINSQIFANSGIFKGFTPLHVSTHRGAHSDFPQNTLPMAKILLENGADVTVTDALQNTPITMLFNYYYKYDKEHASLLIKYHRDFNVNPVGPEGISHFHVACYVNDVQAVRGFLSHGVDVNHPIDYFSQWKPGFTPLHLASKFEVVDLLISYGADIYKQDVRGCSVLAESLMREDFDEDAAKRIIDSGANINSTNISRQTLFEVVITETSIKFKTQMMLEKLKFFIRQGCHVNSCNPTNERGYLGIIIGRRDEDPYLRKLLVETIMKESSSGILGRTTFHHLVAEEDPCISVNEFVDLFEELIKTGHNIDGQDDKGKTALHVAVEFSNRLAVIGLLKSGADINVLDRSGRPAISYVSLSKSKHYKRDMYSQCIQNFLIDHACKLVLLELDLCKINFDSATEKMLDKDMRNRIFQQITVSKSIEIGIRSICLYDFLTETSAIAKYHFLNLFERTKISEYFQAIGNDSRVTEIQNILIFQYRKAIKRIELLNEATNSFRLLLGFDLPDLCAENIFQYLSNYNLVNIVTAGSENDDIRMEMKMAKHSLERLVRLRKNERLKIILQNYNRSELVDGSGITLLHLATKHNNLRLLKYLLSAGFDVDSKTNAGCTPLGIAVKLNRFKALKILLKANADIFGFESQGRTRIKMLMSKLEKFPADVVAEITGNYQRSHVYRETKAKILVNACPPLKFVLTVSDELATAMFLEHNKEIKTEEADSALEFAMQQQNRENARLIIEYMHRLGTLNGTFFWQLYELFTSKKHRNLESAKYFLLGSMDWNIIVRRTVGYYQMMLLSSDKEAIQILMESNINEYIRQIFGVDILVSVFGNDEVDAVELVRKRSFNVNSKTVQENTALHMSSQRRLKKNLEFLLDMGADPNVKNDRELTPLHQSLIKGDQDCGKLLLFYGASFQLIPERDKAYVYCLLDRNPEFFENVIAQVAIDDALSIKEPFRDELEIRWYTIFEKCSKQLKELKNYKISDSLTLFTVLTGKPEELTRRLQNEDYISKVEEYFHEHQVHDFYRSLLNFKLYKSMQIYYSKFSMARIISENTGVQVVSDHLVIEKIFSFLTRYEILQLLESFDVKFGINHIYSLNITQKFE